MIDTAILDANSQNNKKEKALCFVCADPLRKRPHRDFLAVDFSLASNRLYTAVMSAGSRESSSIYKMCNGVDCAPEEQVIAQLLVHVQLLVDWEDPPQK